jgi:hypothetical protein
MIIVMIFNISISYFHKFSFSLFLRIIFHEETDFKGKVG